MKFNPSEPRPYTRRGVKQPGRWEIDLRGTLDSGLEVKRERRVFPAGPTAGKIGKRQAAAMAFEEWQRWNRCGQVLRPGEKPVLARTGTMTSGNVPTFAQFAPDFLEFCASPNASPRGPNSPGTIANRKTYLRLHVLPKFGSMRMDQLTTRDVDRFVVEKAKQGCKAGTLTNMVAVLRRMLKVAKRYELIDTVPVMRTPSASPEGIKTLDPEEATRFLATVPGVFRDARSVLLELYLRSGLRLGEGLALCPTDFDLEAETPTVHVARSWGRDGYGPPKGRKPRSVPLPPSLAARVDELLSDMGVSPRSSSRLLFPSDTDPDEPATRSAVYWWVRKAGSKANTRRVNPHMLRHTFGTECARRGVPLLTIKDWMGHAHVKTTMVYLHLAAPDHLRWAGLLDDPPTEDAR